MSRKKITRTELHAWLEREFQATASGLCARCRVPMPVFREGVAAPNWRLPAHPECPELCHTMLTEIAERAARKFELARG